MERMMYNTVLGAKPLMPDGRTFYYSDYNFEGRKVYREDQHWACCSGTLPQVATDYGINAYFRDAQGIWLNLYIPSRLRWIEQDAEVQLTQSGPYPFDSTVQFAVRTTRPREFTLNFRMPSWADGASISVNGRRQQTSLTPGTFAAVRRVWNNGDVIELDLPAKLRLEPIDPQHPETVALLSGSLVLFALATAQPKLTRADLLAARKVGQRTWQVPTGGEPLRMLPFVDIREEPYSTYLKVT